MNLAMKGVFQAHKNVFESLETIMTALRSGNNPGILEAVQTKHGKKLLHPAASTILKPRWNAKFKLVKRYLEMHEYLNDEALEIVGITRLRPAQLTLLKRIFNMLKDMEALSINLQKSEMTMLDIRVRFDLLISEYGSTYPSLEQYLGAEASIVQSMHFENAIVKLQTGVMAEAALLDDEKATVVKYLIDQNIRNDQDVERADDIIVRAEAKVKRQKLEYQGRPSAYHKVLHVLPTSNIAERLFSRAKLVLHDRRKNLTFSHFEMLLFLWLNRDLWDVKTVQKCTVRSDADNDEHIEMEREVLDFDVDDSLD
jgi:hypothetical protein